MRGMREQDARLILVNISLRQNRAKTRRVGGVTVVHAHDLQAINYDLLIVQYSNACPLERVDIFRWVGKLFVIAGYEICAVPRRQPFQWVHDVFGVDFGSIEQVAGNENDVRVQLLDFANNSTRERWAIDVTEVKIRYEGRSTAAPGAREVGQPDLNFPHPHQARVNQAIQTSHRRKAEQYSCDLRPPNRNP